jgi:hypothetical protein
MMMECVHRWQLPQMTSGPTLTAVCRYCGASKEFSAVPQKRTAPTHDAAGPKGAQPR